MMNIFAETLFWRALQLVLASMFSVVLAVFVVMAEPLKNCEYHEGEKVASFVYSDKGERHRAAQQHGIIAAVLDLSAPQTWSSAKVACESLTLHGFSDWSLPSREELNLLFLGKEALGGFQSGDYWSSSAFADDSAWSKRFFDGKENIRNWENHLQVRPIRKF